MSIGPPFGYTDLMDYVLNKEEDSFNAFPLRPSAAGKCTRQLGYDLSDYYGYTEYGEEKKEPHVKRLLSLGNSVEFSTLQNFSKVKEFFQGFEVKYKQQVLEVGRLTPVDENDDPPIIEGSLDLAVKCNGELGFGDVKSAKDKFSKQHKTKWDETLTQLRGMESVNAVTENYFEVDDLKAFLAELNDPFFEDNFYQLNLYCTTGFAKRHGVTHGFIYRYNKNDSRHVEIRFTPSDEVRDQVFSKFDTVYNKVKSEESAESLPRDYNLGSLRCSVCPYSQICRPGQDSTKAFFNTFPKKKWPTKVPEDSDIEEKFRQYESLLTQKDRLDKLEEEIKNQMEESKIRKVELPNGNIYELKYLKSPRPHTQLRRSKR